MTFDDKLKAFDWLYFQFNICIMFEKKITIFMHFYAVFVAFTLF